MEDELKQFNKTLKCLTSNDKYVINKLSVMAMDARENPVQAKEIAKMALTNIFKVPVNLKLISFYVVDSIIKNVGSPYKEMFSEKIVDAFVHTFQSNKDHDVRLKLYNLRITWKQQFAPDLMNSLDEEVKKFDPAWPLVLQCDPKYKSGDRKTSKTSPDSTTPNLRDPRVNGINVKSEPEIGKKRKPEQSLDSLFMIDRTGDHSIKKKIIETRNIKIEPTEKKVTEFIGKKDLDLRIPPGDILKPKIEFKVPDSKEKSVDKKWTSDDIFKILKGGTKDSRENTPPAQPVTTSAQIQPVAPIPPIASATHLPQPREPIWNIFIDGFPQFPQIGTDPRLLMRCPFYDPFRTITIDGNKYLLYLDRIQPCIFVKNELHAVRFYTQNLEVQINDNTFDMSSNRLTHIKINRRSYIACLGGPGHELIINGWPYNVRIDGNRHQITIGGIPISVQFFIRRQIQVNVQTAIPPYVCEWAVKGLFGSPQYLNMPPLNPLKNVKLQDQQAFRFRYELGAIHSGHSHLHMGTIHGINSSTTSELAKLPQPTSVNSDTKNIDVHDLFKKLLATGIISPNKSKDLKLEIVKFSLETFKTFNDKEINEMYSGHQCDLCGTRFKNKDSKEFELHLDYHFYKNTTNLTANKVSRNFFAGARQWVIGGSVRIVEPDFNFEQTSESEQKFKCPMFEDGESNKCAVCLEGFEVVWDDDEEKFMLQDGQMHNDKVYHPICLEDADKQMESLDESCVSEVDLVQQPLAALQKVLDGQISAVVLPPDSRQSELNEQARLLDIEFDYESAAISVPVDPKSESTVPAAT